MGGVWYRLSKRDFSQAPCVSLYHEEHGRSIYNLNNMTFWCCRLYVYAFIYLYSDYVTTPPALAKRKRVGVAA